MQTSPSDSTRSDYAENWKVKSKAAQTWFAEVKYKLLVKTLTKSEELSRHAEDLGHWKHISLCRPQLSSEEETLRSGN